MKTNKLLFLLFPLILCGCNNSSNFNIVIPYKENGQFIELNGQELYQKVVDDKETLVCLFAIDDCYECNRAKENFSLYALNKHCDLYFVNMSNVNQDDYTYIYQATTYLNGIYAFPNYGSTLELPLAYIFKDQDVVITFNEDFVAKLDKYITITNS